MNEPRAVRLLHVTDPHLFADRAGELYGVRSDATFEAVLAKALRPPARYDAVLATGDIAEDRRRETYERFRDRMRLTGLPVLCIAGNHEDPRLMAALLGDPPLQYCGSMRLGGWRLVMLDSHVPGRDDGRLADGELRRLEESLAATAGEHVLVCLHHQPIPMGSAWLDSVGLTNAADFLAVLDGHDNVRGVLWGHVHQASDRQRGQVRMMSTPSTCAQFTPHTETCVMDLRPPGFRRLELLPDGGIRTDVVWLEELRQSARPPDSRREP